MYFSMLMTDDANRRFYLAHNLLENASTAIINVARAFSYEQNIRYFDEHTVKGHLCAIQNALEGLLKVLKFSR